MREAELERFQARARMAAQAQARGYARTRGVVQCTNELVRRSDDCGLLCALHTGIVGLSAGIGPRRD